MVHYITQNIATHLQCLSVPVDPADLADDEVPGVGPHVVGAGVVLPEGEIRVVNGLSRNVYNIPQFQVDSRYLNAREIAHWKSLVRSNGDSNVQWSHKITRHR